MKEIMAKPFSITNDTKIIEAIHDFYVIQVKNIPVVDKETNL